MTTITNIQRELLTRAASEPEGFVDPETEGRIAKALIRKGLAISLPVEGGQPPCCHWRRPRCAGGKRPASRADGNRADGAARAASCRAGRPPAQGQALSGHCDAEPAGTGTVARMGATGWQAHSVRGAMSGALKKKLGLTIVSDRAEGGERVYRIPASVPPAEEGGADA